MHARTHLPQVRQRPLWRPDPVLPLGQLVGKLDEELAVALALVGGQGEDAGQVVVLAPVLLLAEVANLGQEAGSGPRV